MADRLGSWSTCPLSCRLLTEFGMRPIQPSWLKVGAKLGSTLTVVIFEDRSLTFSRLKDCFSEIRAEQNRIIDFWAPLSKTWIQFQIHRQIGNKVDGFFYWCIPNVDQRIFWQIFQVYMLIIIMVLPTVVMTFAYTSISREVLKLSRADNDTER